MAHFGIICPPITGHVDPLAAVGRTLIGRGHRVTMFHIGDVEQKAIAEGLEFVALGSTRFPAGTLADTVNRLATLKGLASLKYAIDGACRISEIILDHAPDAIRASQIDALLVDQNEPAGATVAEHLDVPFISVCTSLPLNRERHIPPAFVGWPYRASVFGALRNRLGYVVSDRFIAPIQATLNRYRRQWHLRPIAQPDDSFSTRCQLAQMPREFDFPRQRLPDTFHYLGPWFDSHSASVPFPFDALDGRPLVYGSLGTLQPEQSPYFLTMAQACSRLNVQLVLSLGKSDRRQVGDLPGNPIVVGYAPQIELLSRSAVTITHSGMNTTQQSLYFGVPLVAVPLTHDQPAIAARTARTGAGIVIRPRELTPERLQAAIQNLLDKTSSYRMHASRMQEAARRAGGRQRAADLAEQAAGVKSD